MSSFEDRSVEVALEPALSLCRRELDHQIGVRDEAAPDAAITAR
jgi:hypothetical protein